MLSFFFWKIGHRAEHSRVGNLYPIKAAPNKTDGFVGLVFRISESFHASLNYYSHANCLNKRY